MSDKPLGDGIDASLCIDSAFTEFTICLLVDHIVSTHGVQFVTTAATVRNRTSFRSFRLRAVEVDVLFPVSVVGESAAFECFL